MITRAGLLATVAFCLLLAGCGDSDNKAAAPKEAAAPEAAKAVFHDWQSVDLHNGLVTVHLVPQLGGRTMGYELADRELLYANPSRYGHVPGETLVDRGPAKSAPANGGPAKGGAAPDTKALGTPGDKAPAKPATPDAPPTSQAAAPAASAGGVRFAADSTPPPTPSAEAKPDAKPAPGPAAPAKSDDAPLKFIPSPTSAEYVNYGGEVWWPAPQGQWEKPWPPPATLDQGTWGVSVDVAKGDDVSVTLTSPPDDTLGVQITRNVHLARASTVVHSVATLKNVGKMGHVWALESLSQHPGALGEGETFTKDAALVLPLNPKSEFKSGFTALLGAVDEAHYTAKDGLLDIAYDGRETAAGADSNAGWVAYCDQRHQQVFVRLTVVDPDSRYPDHDVSALVYTAPSKVASYLAAALRSPLAALKVDATTSMDLWDGAATCPAPIVAASPVGVVSVPLSAERQGHTVTLGGLFGVFYFGYAQVIFADQAGHELARTTETDITPLAPFHLTTAADLPDGTASATLVVLSRDRVQQGELATASVTEVKARSGADVAAKPAPVDDSGTPHAAKAEPTPAKPDAAGGKASGGEAAATVPGKTLPTAPEVPSVAPSPAPVLPEPQMAQP